MWQAQCLAASWEPDGPPATSDPGTAQRIPRAYAAVVGVRAVGRNAGVHHAEDGSISNACDQERCHRTSLGCGWHVHALAMVHGTFGLLRTSLVGWMKGSCMHAHTDWRCGVGMGQYGWCMLMYQYPLAERQGTQCSTSNADMGHAGAPLTAHSHAAAG